MIAWFIATFLVVIFQCIPISTVFENEKPVGARYCVSGAGALLGAAVPNTLLDIALLVLPFRILWTLQLSARKKIGLCLIFSVGLL